MSKVRIYELAKEAGVKSKELADKLIALGYPVKGYSSTVDEDMANDIRKKVLGNMGPAPLGDRLEGRKKSTVTRRRVKTIRRRRKPEPPPEEHDQVPEQEPVVTADESVSPPREEKPVVAAAEEPLEEKTGVPEVVEEVGKVSPGEAEEIPAGETTEKERPAKAETRKGLARVIKRAAIKLPVEEPVRTRKKKGKGVAAGGRKTVPQMPGRQPLPAVGKPGKKKGKRFVSMQGDDSAGRGRKAGRGGRRGLDRDPFSRGVETYFRPGRRKKPRKGREQQKHERAAQTPVAETKAIKKRIKVFDVISVGDLAKRMGVKANEVIAKLMGLGVMATLNQSLDVDTATLVAADFGFDVEQGMTEELEVIQLQKDEKGGKKVPRPPVVTVMGHVDHGKTSILDAIRKTDVAKGEAGGITQHIGAYYVQAPSGDIVFLDTPGHAAFTEMRSRGAKITDIVILVVAADDGVMDQTREAIRHAQAAEVPIVVAVNKIDKDNAEPDRVMRELGEYGLIPEAWGGDTIFCNTSAKMDIGINELLENVQLLAEMLELEADPSRRAQGRVVEALLHKGRGPVATVLVQEGTLRPGDYFVAGQYYGKVRSLTNDKGQLVKEAGPAMPVEVQGLTGVPLAGDEFIVVPDEKMAKNVSASRQLKIRESELAAASKVSLDNLFEKIAEKEIKELRIVLRADVQGTLEAFSQAAEKLSTDEIKVRVLHDGTGTITENDVHLAAASGAIIIGFNVRPSVKVKDLAEQERVDIRSYDVIYHALEDIEKAMVGMLDPVFEERVIGRAEVRETFSVPKVGVIAGCFVIDGKVERNAGVRVLRDGVVVYTGKVASLRRFKDDVKEVLTGFECGIGVENFNDIKIGDQLEAFQLDQVAATL